jgi:pilus assembly protein CpaF
MDLRFGMGRGRTTSTIAPIPDSVDAFDAPAQAATAKPTLLDERVKIHQRIINDFNLALLDKVAPDDLYRQIGAYIGEYVTQQNLALNQRELELFTKEVIDEMTGLGPLEPLLKDATVADILINTHESVYVERFGQIEPTSIRFKDEAHLLRIINKIVSGVGRRIDESSPMVDARLPDGSRVNVAVRPVAVDGPLMSIRKFSKQPYSMQRLVEAGSLKQPMADLLRLAVIGKLSIIVSGGTGSGKTTMLNALSSFISPKDRLLTIEDAAELQLQQPHVLRLETRPPNAEGAGEIRQRELVKNALRMRPDRIIVGECRGEEAFDMLQAMNTGHEGSMTTIHANNPRDALSRLEQMVGMSSIPMTQVSIRHQIASAINLVVQLQRLSDGKRRVTSISEITGMESEVTQMQEIYRFVRESVDKDGNIIGHHVATGIRPKFLANLQSMGMDLPGTHFEPGKPL